MNSNMETHKMMKSEDTFTFINKYKVTNRISFKNGKEWTNISVPHLSGFMNWILTCKYEHKELLLQGGSKLTEMISQNSIHVKNWHGFVKDCLIPSEHSSVRIGKNHSDNQTLYGIYSLWCVIHSSSFKSFSIRFIKTTRMKSF